MDQIPSNKVATAAQRQQLQESFDRAQRLKSGSAAERETARELFRQCFAADPGNLIYAQSWLSAIDDPDTLLTSRKPRRRFFLSRAVKRAKARENWSRVIEFASLYLTSDDRNAMLLVDMAKACSELEHDNVAILLLGRATELDDGDDRSFRLLAAVLEKLGDFADARRGWLRVKELCPQDAEAERRLAALERGIDAGGSQPREPKSSNDSATCVSPESVEQCLLKVDTLVSGGQFAEANRYLGHALSLFGNDIRLRERSEQLLLDQVQYEIGVAETRLAEQATSENRDLLVGLRGELNRREIDFYATRSQRYPDQPKLQLELGLRLKRAGIYAEAIAEFVDLLNDELYPCTVSVETGECWQSLRQFDRALTFYREAMVICPESHECFKRSRYRAAVLLEAMSNPQQAESLLEEVVQVDPTYKDAATRLDSIRKIRHHT